MGYYVQSAKALNSVVGHEITHVLEGTELYDALAQTITEYAKAKGDYDARLEQLTRLYEGKEGYTGEDAQAKIEREVVADLVGDYLFTDKDFVQRLSTENRNVFQKIWDEVKYLCKVATAGSKEAKQLEKVKKAFEEAYRTETKNPTGEGGTRYSISEIVDASGNNYGIGVHLDSTLLDNLSPKERLEMVKERIKELGGETITAYDPNGNAVDITIAKPGTKFKNQSGKNTPVNKDLATKYIGNEVKQEAVVLLDELITTSRFQGDSPARHKHGWLDNDGQNNWDIWTTYIQDKNGTIWEATLNVANSTNGEKILYDISPIKKVGRSGKSDTLPTDGSVAQDGGGVNNKNSLSEIGQADDIAPLPWEIRGEDVALENFAPIGENVVTKQNAVYEGELGPVREDAVQSQIYNWGIKKDASLDGGRRGPRVASSGVSSDASSNNIPQTPPNVNPDDSTGAAPSGFDPVSHLQYEYGSLPEGYQESAAVIEFESSIDPEFIGTEYGDTNYHTVVTVFEPDIERNGMPFDYAEELLANPDNIELKIEKRQPTESAIGKKHPNTSDELPSSNSIRNPAGVVNTKNSLSEIGQADDIAPPLPWEIKGQDVALFPMPEDIAAIENGKAVSKMENTMEAVAENATTTEDADTPITTVKERLVRFLALCQVLF